MRCCIPPEFDDKHQLSRVKSITLAIYVRHVHALWSWYIRESWQWNCADELDTLLVLWRNDKRENVIKASLTTALAGTEFAIPQFKGRPCWANSVVIGWSTAAPISHTIPLP